MGAEKRLARASFEGEWELKNVRCYYLFLENNEMTHVLEENLGPSYVFVVRRSASVVTNDVTHSTHSKT